VKLGILKEKDPLLFVRKAEKSMRADYTRLMTQRGLGGGGGGPSWAARGEKKAEGKGLDELLQPKPRAQGGGHFGVTPMWGGGQERSRKTVIGNKAVTRTFKPWNGDIGQDAATRGSGVGDFRRTEIKRSGQNLEKMTVRSKKTVRKSKKHIPAI